MDEGATPSVKAKTPKWAAKESCAASLDKPSTAGMSSCELHPVLEAMSFPNKCGHFYSPFVQDSNNQYSLEN